jgi:alkylated DNA repair dioxygenase AlkB
MSQLSLFTKARETTLVDDARGRVTYTADVVPADVAAAWFAEVRASVQWKTQRRMMYDREVDVPRLMAHFCLDPDDGAAPDVVRAAAEKVIAATGAPFNTVGLNFYRDSGDSVAPHNDDLDELVEGFPVVLLSLGATRRMAIRAKERPKRVLNVELEPGSLLIMGYETQLHYTHAIPKLKEPVGPRISLAFRVTRPERSERYRAR